MMTAYDITAIRSQFTALSTADNEGQLPLFLDGPGGSQVPKSVVHAMADYLGCYNSNMGGLADAGRRTTAVNTAARTAAAAWLGCEPDNIIIGLNSTSLMFQISRVLARDWQAGDNIVLSSIDHFSNVSSWQLAAEDRGVQIRKIPLTADGCSLDLSAVADLIDSRTRLVAVSLASNVLGTQTDLGAIHAAMAGTGALLCLDAVHAVVHELVDVTALGCDLLFASSYKLGGAHLGMAYLSDKLIHLKPYKVEPATDIYPMAWEQGTQSFEAQAAMVALMDYWADLSRFSGVDTMNLSLRERLALGYQAVQVHERTLMDTFLNHALARDYFTLYGKDSSDGRTPTFAFNLFKDGSMISPAQVSAWFGEQNIALPFGNFYALDVVRHLGLVDSGFLRAGFLHYNSVAEVERFFSLLDECVAVM